MIGSNEFNYLDYDGIHRHSFFHVIIEELVSTRKEYKTKVTRQSSQDRGHKTEGRSVRAVYKQVAK